MDGIITHGGAIGTLDCSETLSIPFVLISAIAVQVLFKSLFSYKDDAPLINEKENARTCIAQPRRDVEPANKSITREQVDTMEDDDSMEYEALERIIHYLLPHSICRPIRRLLINYLRDQGAVKPIQPCPWLETVTDLPSMVLGSLPLLVPLWILTNYYWTSFLLLMVWDRVGSDVIHHVLSRALKVLGWLWGFPKNSYLAIFGKSDVGSVTKGARMLVPWRDGLEEGHGGNLFYPHRGNA
ncbi:hypothetical protein FZEAL_237 [Fusarium zealandicum]|uniref:Uncharacterized protein n=1 Tax=Fusarium zealandicum TaxID=1053134 RepID=A0A8H4UVL2_9HYPO|nr:hypothetical protein FZEAL_237 [Fusarium zealandicum]